MKKIIRNLLNKRGYEIIKQPYIGNKYPNLSNIKSEYYCETPIGNFYLPAYALEKDAVCNTISRGKYFEPDIIEVAREFVRKGTTVLDIGANFGQMSIEFSKMVGEHGDVYSFEAQEIIHDYLIKNIAANNRNNIRTIKDAVWNESGKTVWFKHIDYNCEAPYSGNYIVEKGAFSCDTITVDSLNISTPISFIKCDIQGSDLFALQGAKNTIEKHKPTILFEFEEQIQDNFKTNFGDYVDFVDSIGYKFVRTISLINYLIAPKCY